jgi:enoyl-CoA hydratase/carnithine racemase
MTVHPHSPLVRTTLDNHVLHIVMNRPQKKNAISFEMYSSLTDTIAQAENDADVRVLLIYGTGGCFTSGNDLRDLLESPPRDENSPLFKFMKILSQAKKPIVAAVQGLAMGIGTTMLLRCDLVYAGGNTRFLLPFVNLGLCPEAASSYLLPLLAGYQRAAELFLLAEPFGAEKAREIGLVNEICKDGDVIRYAESQARKLAAKPQASVLLTKAMLRKANARIVEDVISDEASSLIQRLSSPEAAEAFKAFLARGKAGS